MLLKWPKKRKWCDKGGGRERPKHHRVARPQMRYPKMPEGIISESGVPLTGGDLGFFHLARPKIGKICLLALPKMALKSVLETFLGPFELQNLQKAPFPDPKLARTPVFIAENLFFCPFSPIWSPLFN